MIHNPIAEGDPVDVSIVIEGIQVISGCGHKTKPCMLLMGLIYVLKLEYPKKFKNTFKVFKKTFLELDGGKCLKKVHSVKIKLMEKSASLLYVGGSYPSPKSTYCYSVLF